MTLGGSGKDKEAIARILNTAGIDDITFLVDEKATKDNVVGKIYENDYSILLIHTFSWHTFVKQ